MKNQRGDFTRTTLLRKVRVSASMDKDAVKLLQIFAEQDRRSLSGELNSLLYAEAARRGVPIPSAAAVNKGTAPAEGAKQHE